MATLPELLLEPGVFSLASAAVLGAAHALTPGHGKTIVAAYLAGNRGSSFDALRLGTLVTFTHTASVFFLALLATYVAESLDIQGLYPWLSKLSGLLIAGTGLWLLYRLLRPAPAASSSLAPNSNSHHLPLNALGISGGIVPCPEALALLLLALSRGQSVYGLLLLLSFSLGMAFVLIGIGLAAVLVMPRLKRFEQVLAPLPMMSAILLIVLGMALLF
jgi:nickel/cobalt transporter (NicO) family protein